MRELRAAPFSVAIVGLGPRGLSVLERLLIRLRRHPAPVDVVIWAVDPVEHGPGRVWRTSQPPWLTMNATTSEVTMQSPDSDLSGPGFTRPHSLTTWTASAAYPRPGFDPVDYPPRSVYGEYLRNVFERLCAAAPPGVSVRPLLGEAMALRTGCDGMRLTVCDLEHDQVVDLVVDKAVLATGHGRLEPTEEQRALIRHAGRHADCVYLGEDLAADMPLADIPPGATVAMRGLGLTFYDLIRSLSVGRGGAFVRARSGRLVYTPGGQEPRVVAGSRGGLPFLARPRMTEPPETAPRPIVLTESRLARARARARASRGTAQLDFAGEIEPLIRAEAEHAYYACAARMRGGHRAARRFTTDFLRRLDGSDGHPEPASRELLVRHGLEDLSPLRLDSLGRPFGREVFSSPSAFHRRLLGILRSDVIESRKGTAASPLKAALEVLRQIRPLLPAVVDFGGLLPSSHRDFTTRFEPLSYVLSAGPPDTHVEQLVALIEAGVVEVVGPGARFTADEAGGCFVAESPQVENSRCPVQVLIDARVPGTDIARTGSPLIRQLLVQGRISQYVNCDPATGEQFATGGLAVTRAPFHVVDGRGRPDPDVYAIGVATDRTRWFTQVGTGRPGQDSPLCRDADAIAADVLGAVRVPAPSPRAEEYADRDGVRLVGGR